MIHCWGLPVNFDGLSNSSLERVIFPFNDQGGREVKSVSRVPEVITHGSCRCSCNVVVLLEPDPNNECQTPTMNRDNGYELPLTYGNVLSRGFHHPKSRDKTSQHHHSIKIPKACDLVKFLDPGKETLEHFKIQPPGYSTICQMTPNERLMLKHL